MPVTADDLDEAFDCVAGGLRPAVGRDWRSAVGTGIWTARATAEHVGDCLLAYAAQLIVQPTDRYVPFAAEARDTRAADLLELVRAGAGILAATVRATGSDVRAYHPSGLADAEGFAGMGCVELLVHGEDVARGLHLALDPPREVCERVLARMFPEQAADVEGADPWDGLLWATGRIELPDQERRTSWRWRAAPLE